MSHHRGNDLAKNSPDDTTEPLKSAQSPPPNSSTLPSDIEKAYGGCHICYGKGYHTKRVGTSSRYGNVTHDTIGYCTCDRGKQLELVVASQVAAARIDELTNFNLPQYDHSKCLDKRTCIGYENAQSDFDNEKELRLAELKEPKK